MTGPEQPEPPAQSPCPKEAAGRGHEGAGALACGGASSVGAGSSELAVADQQVENILTPHTAWPSGGAGGPPPPPRVLPLGPIVASRLTRPPGAAATGTRVPMAGALGTVTCRRPRAGRAWGPVTRGGRGAGKPVTGATTPHADSSGGGAHGEGRAFLGFGLRGAFRAGWRVGGLPAHTADRSTRWAEWLLLSQGLSLVDTVPGRVPFICEPQRSEPRGPCPNVREQSRGRGSAGLGSRGRLPSNPPAPPCSPRPPPPPAPRKRVLNSEAALLSAFCTDSSSPLPELAHAVTAALSTGAYRAPLPPGAPGSQR